LFGRVKTNPATEIAEMNKKKSRTIREPPGLDQLCGSTTWRWSGQHRRTLAMLDALASRKPILAQGHPKTSPPTPEGEVYVAYSIG
jgi:hypothetical protein